MNVLPASLFFLSSCIRRPLAHKLHYITLAAVITLGTKGMAWLIIHIHNDRRAAGWGFFYVVPCIGWLAFRCVATKDWVLHEAEMVTAS